MSEYRETIEDLVRRADAMSADIGRLLGVVGDYDLQRLLKKIDADLMDVRHNLNLAKRLAPDGRGQDSEE